MLKHWLVKSLEIIKMTVSNYTVYRRTYRICSKIENIVTQRPLIVQYIYKNYTEKEIFNCVASDITKSNLII